MSVYTHIYKAGYYLESDSNGLPFFPILHLTSTDPVFDAYMGHVKCDSLHTVKSDVCCLEEGGR